MDIGQLIKWVQHEEKSIYKWRLQSVEMNLSSLQQQYAIKQGKKLTRQELAYSNVYIQQINKT